MDYTGDDHVINIGSGQGYSLIEIINLIEIILNKKVLFSTSRERLSDVDVNILDIKKSKTALKLGAANID